MAEEHTEALVDPEQLAIDLATTVQLNTAHALGNIHKAMGEASLKSGIDYFGIMFVYKPNSDEAHVNVVSVLHNETSAMCGLQFLIECLMAKAEESLQTKMPLNNLHHTLVELNKTFTECCKLLAVDPKAKAQ